MIHRYTTFIKTINLTLDYIMLNMSMIIAWYLVNKSYLFQIDHYLSTILLFNLIWLLATNITGLYKHVLIKDSIITYRGLIQTYLLFISMISFTIIVLIGTKTITRQYLFYSLALFGFMLSLWKLVFLGIRKTERASLMDTRTF